MQINSSPVRLIAVGLVCGGVGAGAGVIAQAGATTSHNERNASAGSHQHHLRFDRFRHGRRLALRAVHGDLVVPYRTGFATVTFDRGSVDSVSGQQLMITEGTRTAVYKQLTLTIPTDARVRNNGVLATLSSLSQGERVLVIQGLKHTRVIAHTPRS